MSASALRDEVRQQARPVPAALVLRRRREEGQVREVRRREGAVHGPRQRLAVRNPDARSRPGAKCLNTL